MQIPLHSQSTDSTQLIKMQTPNKSAYFGVGTGINAHYGLLGLELNVKTVEQLYVDAAVGLGSWGTKLSGGLIWMSQDKKGWSYELSYSHSRGYSDFELDLEVEDSLGKEKERAVIVDLKPASTINLIMSHHWAFRNGNRFNLKFGYALPIEDEPFELQSKSYEFTDESKLLLSSMQPGGLLLALSFSFGM